MLGQFQKVMEFLGSLLKKALRLRDMAIECSWNRWHKVSNILLAAGIVSVTTAIFVMLSVWAAWLIPRYHKWSLTICDGCFDTLKSSKMQS